MTPPSACWWLWVCGAREPWFSVSTRALGWRMEWWLSDKCLQWQGRVAARAGAGCSAFITIKNGHLWIITSDPIAGKQHRTEGISIPWDYLQETGCFSSSPTKPQTCLSGAGGSLYLHIFKMSADVLQQLWWHWGGSKAANKKPDPSLQGLWGRIVFACTMQDWRVWDKGWPVGCFEMKDLLTWEWKFFGLAGIHLTVGTNAVVLLTCGFFCF